MGSSAGPTRSSSLAVSARAAVPRLMPERPLAVSASGGWAVRPAGDGATDCGRDSALGSPSGDPEYRSPESDATESRHSVASVPPGRVGHSPESRRRSLRGELFAADRLLLAMRLHPSKLLHVPADNSESTHIRVCCRRVLACSRPARITRDAENGMQLTSPVAPPTPPTCRSRWCRNLRSTPPLRPCVGRGRTGRSSATAAAQRSAHRARSPSGSRASAGGSAPAPSRNSLRTTAVCRARGLCVRGRVRARRTWNSNTRGWPSCAAGTASARSCWSAETHSG